MTKAMWTLMRALATLTIAATLVNGALETVPGAWTRSIETGLPLWSPRVERKANR